MDFLRERNRIVAENKASEAAADKTKSKRNAEIKEAVELLGLIFLIALLITVAVWGTMEYINFMRR